MDLYVHKRLIFRLITVTILLVLIYVFLFPLNDESLVVETSLVEQGKVERTVSNTRAGTIVACDRAQMSPGTGGQIAKLEVNDGDAVKKGQLLLELWNDDLRAHIDLSKSELDASLDKSRAACLSAQAAQREADRTRELSKKGLTSEKQTDIAVTDAKASSADCRAARASVEVARSKLGVAQANLDRTSLHAPFDGTIAEVNGSVGEYVTPSPPGIATRPVIDLISNNCFYVNAPIDEVDVAHVKLEMLTRITLDAFSDRVFEGKVRRISPYVIDLEREARTVVVEVNFVKPEDLKVMLAGYSTDVEIVIDTHLKALRIPTEAVLEGGRVYVLDDGVLEQRSVKTGIANWEYTEILSGLSEGEIVVTSTDRDGLRDGARASDARTGK